MTPPKGRHLHFWAGTELPTPTGAPRTDRSDVAEHADQSMKTRDVANGC
jgi:hypothetical protein